jgi:EAL domain-containing protein (putative c-di-GMP-specific phosphodiesterase class I)
MAEEIGLIVPLGKWVLETACRQCQEWVAAGYDTLKVSVNISAVQFGNKEELVNTVTGALEKSGLAPGNLEIEITESTVMRNMESARSALEELHGIGINIAIDDFGTGYSSLASLKQFPIQALKIDKSFIQDLVEDQDDCAIVSAIISMAHKLSLFVIAEGVETREQLDFLRQESGDEIQGYYFSRPVPAEDITKMLVENRTLELL